MRASPTLPITASSAAEVAPARTTEATALDAGKRKAVLDAAIGKMRADYVFPEKVPTIAKALRATLASGKYDALTAPDTFITAVNRLSA